MDLERIAARIAGYDFKTKMKINVLVIGEVARASGLDENAAAAALSDSGVHEAIQNLADAIQAEADRLKEKGAA